MKYFKNSFVSFELDYLALSGFHLGAYITFFNNLCLTLNTICLNLQFENDAMTNVGYHQIHGNLLFLCQLLLLIPFFVFSAER